MDGFVHFDFDSDNALGLDNVCVNFISLHTTEKKTKEIPKIEYDFETTEKYKAFRRRKMDPINYMEIDPENAFTFEEKWDPYTGQRGDKDSDGALFFDPDILIKYFHTKRYYKLFVPPSSEGSGLYEGYYDDGVGAGEDFYISGRGHHPEWYIFRLPIIDCYLTKDHNKQFITFGPRLTDEEIKQIDMLASKRPDNYKKLFGYDRPSLFEMKKLYDVAICSDPISNYNNLTQNKEIPMKINRLAVDKLVKMKG